MDTILEQLLSHIPIGPDAIYSGHSIIDINQVTEIKLREKVASRQYDNYLETIAGSHSIPVMDHEVDQFLSKMPEGAIILDIGGCWGWHWRLLAEKRPDVKVVIIDFVRANLLHAKNVLGPLVGKQVVLMEADATSLPFTINDQFKGFHGIWTVQTFQHIPDFKKAVSEAYRLLIPGGIFANYSLHITPFNRMIYRIMGKKYHIKGEVQGSYYLERANQNQFDVIVSFFGKDAVSNKYTECLFHPDLKLGFSGRVNSSLGLLDNALSKFPGIGRFLARQRAFLAIKSHNNV